MAMVVVLTPLTPDERGAFATAIVADYLDSAGTGGEGADQLAAHVPAQAAIEAEVEAAVQAGDRFWAGHNAEGATVGWLWVKRSLERLPPSAAFLYQILVRAEVRRQGYGAAMLAALEDVLAAEGWNELRLNVWDTNEAGRRLYERTGYQLVERLEGKRQLSKRLPPARPVPSGAG